MPLSDWMASVKWSTAAVNSRVLPPDWFSWGHPPLRSSFPQPKSSLLSLIWIAVLQPHKTHSVMNEQSNLLCFKNQCGVFTAAKGPICLLTLDGCDSWDITNTFPCVHTRRTIYTSGDITSFSFAAVTVASTWYFLIILYCSIFVTCVVMSLCMKRS